MTRPLGRGRGRVLVCLTLAGVACLGSACTAQDDGSDRPAASTSQSVIEPDDAPSTTPGTGSGTVTEAASVPRSAKPTLLEIPAIDVATPLVSLGLQDDDTVEVPADPDLAGWYRFGVPPGHQGAAVILGHVDSVDGPAVFARLGSLRVGDELQVELDTGATVGFAVTGVQTFANADFPARRVYRSRGGHHDLNLVTCGGVYDAANGGYQSNVVVFTREIR